MSAPDCAARLPCWSGLGPAAVLPTAQAVMGAQGCARECLVEGLTTLSRRPRARSSSRRWPRRWAGASDKEERLVTAALARAAAVPVSPLAALLASDKAPEEDRARAARVLGALDDERRPRLLVDALGRGPTRCAPGGRRARPRAQAARPGVLAAIAAGPHEGGPREADLLRALPAVRQARSGPARPTPSASLRAALAPERASRCAAARYGAGGAGHRGDPARAGDVREHGDEPVLRYLATRELAGLAPATPASIRAPPCARALDDTDPRVRETAALALGKQRDTDAAPALIAGAKQEPWPFVRRAELEALGHAVRAGAGDLMLRAVARTSTRCAGRRWSARALQGRAHPRVLLQDRRAATTRPPPCASWRRR